MLWSLEFDFRNVFVSFFQGIQAAYSKHGFY